MSDQPATEGDLQKVLAEAAAKPRPKFMTGRNFPQAIREALGLPRLTQEFTMTVKKDQPVMIQCTYIPEFIGQSQADDLLEEGSAKPA